MVTLLAFVDGDSLTLTSPLVVPNVYAEGFTSVAHTDNTPVGAPEEETAAAGEEDAEIYYADLSAALAGSLWVSTDEEIYLFGDDGSTFYVTDGELEAVGTYAFEMLTDGEDGLMGITLSVVDDELGIDLEATYFVTELDEENSILYLIDEDGNEAAWVEAE